jgi:hypothetical protein
MKWVKVRSVCVCVCGKNKVKPGSVSLLFDLISVVY